jgi:hypothetical protein
VPTDPRQLAILAVVLGVALWLLRRNLWRALLYLSPSTARIEEDAPADAKLNLPDELVPLADELRAVGLAFIGAHLELPRFGPTFTLYDYGSPKAQTFASLFLSPDGAPRVELFTPMQGGGFVRTANYRRSALELPGYFSGYLERVPLDRLVTAHQRRVAALGEPIPAWDITARVAAARTWYQSAGAQAELRQQHQQGLAMTFGAVVIFGLALVTVVG